MEADWKLNVMDGGLVRFKISRCRWESMDRMSMACGAAMLAYRDDVPVSRVKNSAAAGSEDGGRR